VAIEIDGFEQLEDVRAASLYRRVSGSVRADDDSLRHDGKLQGDGPGAHGLVDSRSVLTGTCNKADAARIQESSPTQVIHRSRDRGSLCESVNGTTARNIYPLG
jgi:hypothetical protein